METDIVQKNSLEKPIFTLSGIIVIMLGVLLFAQFRVDRAEKEGALPREKMMEFANKLKNAGLIDEARDAFEEYLETADETPAKTANIYYAIGEAYLKKGYLEEALAYYFKAETADPESSLKAEIGSRIVNCYERLGMTLDAESALASRASLKGADASAAGVKEGETLALIGNRAITNADLDKALGRMPYLLREQVEKSPEKKIEILKSLIVMELLFEKGMKLGVDRDEDILRETEEFRKQIIARKTIETEYQEQAQADEELLEIYYKANEKRYRQPERVKIRYIKLADEAKANDVLARINSGEDFGILAGELSEDEATKDKGGEQGGWILSGDYVGTLGRAPEFNKALFEMEKPGDRKIISFGGSSYVVEILEKVPSEILPFEIIADQVRYEYEQEMHLKIMDKLIKELIKLKGVKIFEEKILKKT